MEEKDSSLDFTTKIGELLMRVKTKQQEKLTAKDLEAAAAWLDEHEVTIDDLFTDSTGRQSTPLWQAASLRRLRVGTCCGAGNTLHAEQSRPYAGLWDRSQGT